MEALRCSREAKKSRKRKRPPFGPSHRGVTAPLTAFARAARVCYTCCGRGDSEARIARGPVPGLRGLQLWIFRPKTAAGRACERVPAAVP
jgi:hypothetical protein